MSDSISRPNPSPSPVWRTLASTRRPASCKARKHGGGGKKKHAVLQRQDSSWVSSCLPTAGQLGSVYGKAFVAGNGLWPRRVATRRANNAERSGLANKPSPESNSSCQRGERARCLAVTVSNRQIRASARPALPGEVNKTLSESFGHNNMQRGARQQRHSRPYSPPSPRWRQPCPWKRTLAAPESRHDRPAAMTAHIPEVDSCYAADLTRSPLPHPQVVNSEEKAGLDVRA